MTEKAISKEKAALIEQVKQIAHVQTEMTKPEKLLCTISWYSEFTTTTAMQP